MNIEDIREYCMDKAMVSEEFPFDSDTLAFKVLDKIFLLTNLTKPEPSINLKCNPEWALELRERHPEVQPGFHMNKKHWNTVQLSEGLTESLVKQMIDHSYDCVVAGMTKKKRTLLDAST